MAGILARFMTGMIQHNKSKHVHGSVHFNSYESCLQNKESKNEVGC